MNKLQVLTRDQVEPRVQGIFDDLKTKIGMVPNIYAVIGNSANALESFLAFSAAQTKGSFNAKEREAVSLAVSEVNGCTYCLAAHTAIAKMNGFTEEETLQLRAGSSHDPKLAALTRLAVSIVKNLGKADPDVVVDFFAAGYAVSALVDLVALVTERNFANYIGRLSGVPADFPKALPLEGALQKAELAEARN